MRGAAQSHYVVRAGQTPAGLMRVVAMLATTAIAQSLKATDSPSQPGSANSPDLGLAINQGSRLSMLASLVPALTSASTELSSPDGIKGTLTLTDSNSASNLVSSDIAYVSCDAPESMGDMPPLDVLNLAFKAKVPGVIVFSRSSKYCAYSSGESGANSSLATPVYSMASTSESRSVENMLRANAGTLPATRIQLASAILAMSNATNATSQGSSSSSSSSGFGGSGTTAVAMIVLYSISATITALFVVIIITGAIRAHRHPERYGPRNVAGRPRQSRARSLARAMLETLPIVKFGETDASKPPDTEMGRPANAATADNPDHASSSHDVARSGDGADGADGDPSLRHGHPILSSPDEPAGHIDVGESSSSAAAAATPATPATTNASGPATTGSTLRLGSSDTPHDAAEGSSSSAAAAVATADAGYDSTESQEGSLACSICTEDFALGEDIRVLPCDHKFHPACVDPWLLEVSGTCPLCRIDLRPALSNASDDGASGYDTATASGSGNMPTDTYHEHPYADGSRSSRRYSSLLRASVINRLRDASASERIAGILRMRDERRRESGSSTTLDGRRRGMAARLQERFSVRTRRRQGSGLVDRAVTATPDAAIGLSSHAEDGPDRPESTDHTVTPAPVT